jgi:hypothetical protein
MLSMCRNMARARHERPLPVYGHSASEKSSSEMGWDGMAMGCIKRQRGITSRARYHYPNSTDPRPKSASAGKACCAKIAATDKVEITPCSSSPTRAHTGTKPTGAAAWSVPAERLPCLTSRAVRTDTRAAGTGTMGT